MFWVTQQPVSPRLVYILVTLISHNVSSTS